MSEDIAKLKYWLSLPGNTKSKLANLVGNDSSTSIQLWIDRGHIPKKHYKIMEIIDGDITQSGKKRQNQKTASSFNLRA